MSSDEAKLSLSIFRNVAFRPINARYIHIHIYRPYSRCVQWSTVNQISQDKKENMLLGVMNCRKKTLVMLVI